MASLAHQDTSLVGMAPTWYPLPKMLGTTTATTKHWNSIQKVMIMIEKLAQIDHLSVNKWLVQICKNNVWYTEYFAAPTTGVPDVIHETKKAAIAACLEKATG